MEMMSPTSIDDHSACNELYCRSVGVNAMFTIHASAGLTCPPATTGMYADPSQVLVLNLYSIYVARSFSFVQVCRIVSVKALPEACPAFRIFAISASLLRLRISFIISFRGSTAVD